MKNKNFIPISIGDRVQTKDGPGIVEEITPPPFPFRVKLDNGGFAWQNPNHIIGKIGNTTDSNNKKH